MTVRAKSLIILGMTFLVLLVVIYLASTNVLLRDFAGLEHQQMRDSVGRVRAALFDHLNDLPRRAHDWASWDDMYAYVADPAAHPEIAKTYLTPAMLSKQNINLFILLDTKDKLVYGRMLDADGNPITPSPADFAKSLAETHPLRAQASLATPVKGFVMVGKQPMLVSARPVLPENEIGESRGTLIVGRALDAALMKQIADATHIEYAYKPFNDPGLPPDFQVARNTLTKQHGVFTRQLDGTTMAGYLLVADLENNPLLIFRVDAPRPIYQHGEKSMRFFLFALLGISALTAILVLVMLERMIFSRLSRLSEGVSTIGAQGDLSARIALPGKDEFGQLAVVFNDTLAKLDASQQQLRRTAALEESESRYRALVELSPDAVLICQDGLCVFANAAATTLFAPQTELVGRPLHALVDAGIIDATAHCLAQGENFTEQPRLEGRILCSKDVRVDVEVAFSWFRYRERDAIQLVAHDIRERKATEERLNYLAYFDSLTNLPNRQLFNDRLGQAVSRARRYNELLSVAMLDLDRFKEINDALGHDVGDQLLQEVAKRVQLCLRHCDSVTRTGGDEFFLILPNLTREGNPEIIANRILEAFATPFTVGEHELYITTSIGITVFPQDADQPEGLVRNADLAMYRAKAQGRNTFKFFSPDMSAAIAQRRQMESALRRALDRGELFVAYQPQVDSVTENLVGVEALVRWKHAEWGMVSPALFIPLAEETGLVEPLDEFVLQAACVQNTRWQMEGLPQLRMAVNISARHFQQRDFTETVTRILNDTGMAPSLLELEITESTAMHNIEHTQTVLNSLHDLGVRIAIDDFGTGHSSLNYLKRFPIQTLKIDRTFIQDMLHDQDDAAIVAAIIGMSHTLRLHVIAEAVETREQLDYLRDLDCDEIQGYLFGKPMSPEDLASLVRGMMVKG